jgi:hypothetical protein
VEGYSMIDEIDRSLGEWVGSVVTDTDVLLSLPREGVKRPAVSFQLMEIVNAVPSRREQPRPLEVSLRYLVTTWAETPEAAHHLLGEVLFAAMETGDFQVELKPLGADMWAAFGVAPQPAFLLQVPLVKQRPQPVKRVLERPEVRVAGVTGLTGIVLGPKDIPIPRARVELPSSNAVTYTDADGRFRFGAVPAAPRTKQLRIVAKGSEQLVSEEPSENEFLVIHFHPKET